MADSTHDIAKLFADSLSDDGSVTVDWLRKHAAEDIVWEVEAMHLPDVGLVEGKEAVIRAFESWRSPWDRIVVTPHSIDAIGDFVVMHYSHEFFQDAAGLHFAGTVAVLVEFRDGRAVRMRWYWDPEEARADAREG